MKRKLGSVILSILVSVSGVGTSMGEILPHNSDVLAKPGVVMKEGIGTPIINIVAPNGAGLSHNKYERFDVDGNGVVINNAQGAAESVIIGGEIEGNPNLTERAARVILNEIMCDTRSAIEGSVEIAGASAELVMANAYGFSMNGANFINAKKVRLVAGVAEVAEEAIKSFSIGREGDIEIGVNGVESGSAVEIVGRHVKIAGEIKAREIEIKTGNKEYDYERGEVISGDVEGRAEEGEGQLYAVSGRAFGSIHGERIKIVATESGLGVKTVRDGNLVSDIGEIWIESEGSIEVGGNITSADVVSIKSKEELKNGGAIKGRDIDITANAVTNDNATIWSIGDTTIETQTLSNTGGTLKSDGNINVETKTLKNERGAITSAQDAVIKITGQALTIEGAISSGGKFTLTSVSDITNKASVNGNEISIQGAKIENSAEGKLTSAQNLEITGREINNYGSIKSNGDMRLSSLSGILNNANIKSSGLVEITAWQALENKLSLSGGDIKIRASSVNNTGGEIKAGNSVEIETREIANEDLTSEEAEKITAGLKLWF
jgi:filamentous hemagglutinin